jgi:hypothetical protein
MVDTLPPGSSNDNELSAGPVKKADDFMPAPAQPTDKHIVEHDFGQQSDVWPGKGNLV